MLDSLYIKNFRLFKELTIEKLGRVNLIVGRNNSGKTCLLEALWIYGSNANPAVLEKIIYQRDESGAGFCSSEQAIQYMD
jgi:AAA15 family ATPase/GTPase